MCYVLACVHSTFVQILPLMHKLWYLYFSAKTYMYTHKQSLYVHVHGCINKLQHITCTCMQVNVFSLTLKSIQLCNVCIRQSVYLLKVASFDVGIFHLPEVGKAVVVTRVRLQRIRKTTTYQYKCKYTST